jgi:two-component system cell cycle sensor histidine kinase/response regulator CckA
VAVQMAEINQQLLTLGRRGHYNLTIINLNTLMEKLVESLSLPATVLLHKEFDQDLFPIKGGSAQLSRVFTNLINNAVEAMGGIGKLNISMKNIYLERSLKGYETIQRGEYVKVCIEDTGGGIEPEALEKIFEPFFTTKIADKQRGSGLGLSVVRAVLEDHNGYVGIDSVTGRGTAFTLYFPITREIESDKESPLKGIPEGNERVLVVDDDPIQREVLTRLLNQLGYKNHAVESGDMAIEYIKEHPQDILILDMVMEGIDGTETYRRIKEFYPDQKAVILSGYAESGRVAEAQRMGADAYVRKPIDLMILAGTIRKALDG